MSVVGAVVGVVPVAPYIHESKGRVKDGYRLILLRAICFFNDELDIGLKFHAKDCKSLLGYQSPEKSDIDSIDPNGYH